MGDEINWAHLGFGLRLILVKHWKMEKMRDSHDNIGIQCSSSSGDAPPGSTGYLVAHLAVL